MDQTSPDQNKRVIIEIFKNDFRFEYYLLYTSLLSIRLRDNCVIKADELFIISYHIIRLFHYNYRFNCIDKKYNYYIMLCPT